MLTLLAIASFFQAHFDSKRTSFSSVLWIFIMSLEDRFKAAVRVIQTLPKEGSYQPSNTLKLRFYSLYKQATEGRCTQSKPSVFNIIGRAKWDAWDKLGDLSSEDCMSAYIEELKGIVETMSFSGDVQEFLDSIGPFYEFVNLEGSNMSHIKERLDNWASSSSSNSNSSASSANTSPLKVPVENGVCGQDKTPEVSLVNGTPLVKKANGHLPNQDQNDKTSTSFSFTAPPAPVHRASKSNISFSNGNDHSEQDNSDEILEIDEVSHEYQIHHSQGRASNESIQSGTESEKYYSGDSEPDVDIDDRFSASTAMMPSLSDPHIPLTNGYVGGAKSKTRQKVVPFKVEDKLQAYSGVGMNLIQDGSPEYVLQNTVDRLNRDVDHILARLRILEAAYSSNGPMPGIQGPGSKLKRKGFFGDLSARSLTLIITWPFVAYFILKLLKWWFTRRFKME